MDSNDLDSLMNGLWTPSSSFTKLNKELVLTNGKRFKITGIEYIRLYVQLIPIL